ncbi:MAG: filamentous hemagglutinin N-terminal domain-containing protein, partial [Verrucomicrobiales bacterium]|nr:filamentous hemagglutinin N-terminal domain-containing protein [Verrucomicrobiales bacterium]
MKYSASPASSCSSYLRKTASLQWLVTAFLLPAFFFWTPVYSNPRGGVVVHGDVQFSGGAGNLQIRQNSRNAIINWDDFSIDAGELTQFRQPNSKAAVLNRVTGGSPTAIHGALRANGNVFVINPNGILIGAGGTIDVHGLVLSTLDVSDGEFLAGGDMVFKGNSDAGITNMGRINGIGGDVFLIGKTISNSGSITATGTVGLGAGEEVLLSAGESKTGERLFVRATGAGASGTGIFNDGTIQGAAVELKAHGNMYALAINNKGSVRATSATSSGGRVFLRGAGGAVRNSGDISVSSPGIGSGGRAVIDAAYARVDGMIRAQGGSIRIASTGSAEVGATLDVSSSFSKGGDIVIEGEDIEVSSTASFNASGRTGGGTMQIGGGFQGASSEVENAVSLKVAEGATMEANSLETGNGGVVILWSDGDTIYNGDISAAALGASGNGGFAEISGKQNLGYYGAVDLTAANGQAGTVLLDPTDVTISSAAGGGTNVNNVDLSNTLDAGTNVVITTALTSPALFEQGNITVDDRVEWYADSAGTTPGTLTLLAQGSVIIRDSVRSAGTGGINIVAGWDGSTGIVNPLDASNPQNDNHPGGFDMAAILNTMNDGNAANDAAGLLGGNVIIGSTNATLTGRVNLDAQVVVGSRFGDTNVAGHDLYMWGANNGAEKFVQLGFRDSGYEMVRSIDGGALGLGTANNGLYSEWWGSNGAADGSGGATTFGNILGKDYIALLGGTRFNGGEFDGAGSGADGDIVIGLSGRVDMRTGDDDRDYVQIGHGGSTQAGLESSRNNNATHTFTTRDGYVMDSYDNGRQFFSSTWRTNVVANPYNGEVVAPAGLERDYRVRGDITINADEDISMLAAPDFATSGDNVANNDAQSGMYAQIGHGGAENHGSYHGNISVNAGGADADGIGINVIGGRATYRYAQIGHGSSGEGNRFTILDQTRSGSIDVEATTGAIRMQGYNEPVGGSESGWTYGQVQIGHGGAYASAPAFPNHSSQIDRGTFRLPDGTIISGQDGVDNHQSAAPDNSTEGDIRVFAGGTYTDARYADPLDPNSKIGISGQGGNSRYSAAQIGHGGSNQRANTSTQNPGATGYGGNIDVQAPEGDILFAGGGDQRVNRDWGYGGNFAKIGHGGRDVDGAKRGIISVLAGQGAGATDGDILFTAGKHYESFAHIGHGGYSSSGNYNSAANEADITVTAHGDIRFESGEAGETNALENSEGYANWWFNDRVNNTNRRGYWAANDRFVMIGHGGYESDGVMANTQHITVTAGTGDIGAQLGGADGNVDTGGITFIGGNHDRDFAMIGHGGYGNGANDANGFNGNVTVTAHGGGVVFDGTLQGGQRFTQQTRSFDGTASTTRIMQAYDSTFGAFLQIGHGGYAARGRHSGAIDIFSNGNVDVMSTTDDPLTPISFSTAGGDNLTHLSNGVDLANSQANVYMSLTPLTDTAATTANENNPATTTGNFGAAFLGRANVKPGTLRIVLTDGTVISDLPDAGNDERTSFLVDDQGNTVGEIVYDQAVVRFNAAQIGSGAADVETVDYQSITGRNEHNYAQIGHGGYESDGPNSNRLGGGNSGSIDITAASDIRMHAADWHRSYTMIGHGGLDVKGSHNGDITIDIAPGTTGGKLELIAGNGHRHYDYETFSKLGHGGHESDGNHYGDITVTNGRNAVDGLGVLLKAGSTQESTAQIGHGGYGARSGDTEADGTTAFGLNGDIVINTAGDVSVISGTGKTNRPSDQEWYDDFRISAMIGHGGWDADPINGNTDHRGQNGGIGFMRTAIGDTNAGTAGIGAEKWGHFGDIVIHSSQGDVNVFAGSTVALDQRVDLEGNPLPLPDDPNGFLISEGEGHGRFLWGQIGHGGYAAGGNHHGSIEVIAEDGSVNVVGGMMTTENESDRFHWAQIGHGGVNDGGHTGRSDEIIRVHGLGDEGNVVVAGGTGRVTPAQIGNGGYNHDGTHLGDIEIYAGNNIVLQGGVPLVRTGLTRIGEYGDINGADGGHANDLQHFNFHYGADNLGLLLMDQAAAAGGGQKTRLMNENVYAGSVEFRLQKGEAFDPDSAPHITDDGAGNLVTQQAISDGAISIGAGVTVGSIDYATGEVTWDQAVATDTQTSPDVFVNYQVDSYIIHDTYRSLAMIGHGGTGNRSVAGAHPEGVAANNGHSGNISVFAGWDANAGAFNATATDGSVIGMGGTDQRSFVQIGHGGDDAQAQVGHAYTGDIDVRAHNQIKFRGGNGIVDNFTVAFDYGGDGDIDSVPNSINDGIDDNLSHGRSSAALNNIYYSFAQIGHGGYNADSNNSVDNNSNDPLDMTDGHNGNISVTANTGNVDFLAGGVRGYGMYTQIGHGGVSTNGNHFGDITVEATAGDVLFEGGGTVYRGNADQKRNYSMIGHGGYAMTGNLGRVDDTTTVTAGGRISFSGGDAEGGRTNVPWAAHVYVMNRAGNNDENLQQRGDNRESWAMIGNGGSNVYGDKQGNIVVNAGTGIDFNGGVQLNANRDDATYDNFAMIGHGGTDSYRHFRNNINPADLGGIGPTSHINRADDFNVFSNLDGTGLPFFPIDNAGNYLPDGFEGDITVTSTAGDIVFTGGNSHYTFAKVGHGGSFTPGDHKGDITVDAQAGDITFNADVDLHGTNGGLNGSGNNTYVQIGHGGFYSDGEIGAGNIAGVDFTTDIFVNAGGTGNITFDGADSGAFAQIGHGGYSAIGTSTTTWTTPDFRHAGGNNYGYRPGTRSGNIDVDATGDINFTGGNTDGDYNHAMIGHGGREIAANPNSVYGDGHSGQIDVTTTGGEITFKAGERIGAFTMIGHGGYQSFGNHGGDGVSDARLDSDIAVEAANGITFLSGSRSNSNADGRNFAMVGHGGWKASYRDIQDYSSSHYAIIGPYNDGYPASNGGAHPWVPFTTNPDGLAMTIGTGDLIGTPGVVGAGAATLGTFMGDITVRTTGAGADISFRAPNETDGTLVRGGDEAFVQIGHGGFYNFADVEGDITVESAGGIDFQSVQGQSNDGRTTNAQGAYALLGHGGYESGGDFSGAITVTSENSILFKGADSADGANVGFAQLGHGGFNSDDDHGQYLDAAKDAAGNRPATSGGVAASPDDVGNSGNITVTVNNGDLEFLAGKDSDTYAQLGHGGRSTRDTHNGDITVNVSGGIRFIAGTDQGTGNINPGGNERAYAMLGHGGHDSDGSHFGDISVTAGSFAAGPEAGRGIVFRGGDHNQTNAQLGHGGRDSRTYGQVATGGAGLEGDITVAAGGEIRFVAGSFHKNLSPFDVGNEANNYVQIGHGGYGVDAYFDADRQLASGIVEGHSGDISVSTSAGGITFLAAQSGLGTHAGDGGGSYHYAQIGHGGAQAQGDHNGSIEVRAGIAADRTGADATANVLFAAGGGTTDDWADNNNYAQIGHGGRMDGNSASSSGNFGLATDTITVMSGGDVQLLGGNGVNNYAQIGNGGMNARGDHSGDIQIFAENNFVAQGSQFRQDGSTGSYTASYSFQRTDGDNNEHRSLDRAGEFLADTDNTTRAAGEADLQFNNAVQGSMVVTVRDDAGNIVMTLADSNNDGTLVVQSVDPGITNVDPVSVGDTVGSYTTSRIQFNQDINPGSNAYGGTRNIGVTYQSTNVTRGYAQVGHGGYDADLPNGSATDPAYVGNISVVARTGNLQVLGGHDNQTSSTIGHGGHATRGIMSGNIFARAGLGVEVDAGDKDQGHAQIGHGGWDADGNKTGHIKVSAGTGALWTNLGTGLFNDMGDFDLDGNADEIQFATSDTTLGTVELSGGESTNESWAQIGHGGRSSQGSGSDLYTGDIGVSATSDVDLLGGTGSRNYAQVGHGGWDAGSAVNISGGVSVITEGGDILLDAGGFNAYAVIGHGGDDDDKTVNLGGTRQGGINVLGNEITLARNGNRTAWIGHIFDMAVDQDNPFSNSSALANAADNLGGGYSVIAMDGLNIGAGANSTFTINDYIRDTLITPNLEAG